MIQVQENMDPRQEEQLALNEAKRLVNDPSYLLSTMFQNNPKGTADAFHGVAGIEDVNSSALAIQCFNQVVKEDKAKAIELLQQIPFDFDAAPNYVAKAVRMLYFNSI